MNDPYKVLNVSPTATEEEIKSAYRKIALETHPDRNGGNHQKTEMFRNATDAYHFLLDKAQREAYDYYRTSQNSAYSDIFYEKKTTENKAQSVKTERDLHNAFMEAKNNLQDMWFNILIGLGSLALGAIPTLISYMMASPGEHYRVYGGLILVGAIGVLKGLFGAVVALGNMASIKAKEKNIFGSGEKQSRNQNAESERRDSSSSRREKKEASDFNKAGFNRTTNTRSESKKASPGDDEIRFCYKCGHSLDSDAVFCDKCGTRIR